MVWFHLKVTANMPLLLVSALLVSAQNREEGDLSSPGLAQGEDRSALWVRCGDGCRRTGGEGRVLGIGQLERGARGGESESCDDSSLTAGDPPAGSHWQVFQSPTEGSQCSRGSEIEIANALE